jgi:aryl-alcohol dehydrogenase-like predicted oxidoreductase
MNWRLFGERTGLRVSSLALGTGRIGLDAERRPDPEEAQRVLEAYAKAGGNFVDTSSAYQLGAAEEALGRFLREAGRDDFVVASKYGRTARAAPGMASAGSHRKAMRAEVEASLRRLGTDRIDIYFVHFDDGLTPIEEIVRGFDDLVRAGKVLYVGFSNFSAWRCASAAMMAELRGWSPLVALQLQYNLLQRDPDREHLPFARAAGLGVMAYSPLASGVLGRHDRVADGGPADSAAARAMRVTAALATIAGELERVPATVAIAWLCAKGLVPVIGPRNAEQLAGGLAACEFELTDDHVRRLDAASAQPPGYPYELLEATRERAGMVSVRSGLVL